MSSTFVDGDVFAADAGSLVRFVGGKNDGWDAKDPADSLLRAAPSYSIVSAGPARREGQIFGFDRPNGRIVALTKVDGKYVAQYRSANGASAWSDLRAMYIIAGNDTAPSTLVWASRDGVHQAILVAVPDVAPAAGPSSSPGASTSPAKTTAKPSKKP